MVRLIPEHGSNHVGSSIPLAIGLFVSVSALVALCAKRYSPRRAPKELEKENKMIDNSTLTPKSPLVLMSPKKLVTSISNKASPSIYKKGGGGDDEFEGEGEGEVVDHQGGFGEGGLWQKGILMGERCQPPEFSGAIHYDNFGNRLSELPPKSPRASPLPAFLFPEVKEYKDAN